MLSSATKSRVSSQSLNLIHTIQQYSWPQISVKEQLSPVVSLAAMTIQAPARQQDRAQSSHVQASV